MISIQQNQSQPSTSSGSSTSTISAPKSIQTQNDFRGKRQLLDPALLEQIIEESSVWRIIGFLCKWKITKFNHVFFCSIMWVFLETIMVHYWNFSILYNVFVLEDIWCEILLTYFDRQEKWKWLKIFATFIWW